MLEKLLLSEEPQSKGYLLFPPDQRRKPVQGGGTRDVKSGEWQNQGEYQNKGKQKVRPYKSKPNITNRRGESRIRPVRNIITYSIQKVVSSGKEAIRSGRQVDKLSN
ncbi:MAG: hypothetical protein WCG31_10200 [Deltaproteobacteria bacterium]